MADTLLVPERTLGRKAQWDRAADDYARNFRSGAASAYAEAEAAIILSWLDRAPGKDVLEICCGAGRNSRRVAAAGYRLTAVDIAPGMLRHARRAVADSGSAAQFAQANAVFLPFRDESFDAVYGTRFFYILTHSEKRAMIADIWRVLRPGGLFILQFNCLPWGYYRELARFLFEDGAYRIRNRYFGPKHVGQVLRPFHVLQTRGVILPRYTLVRRVLGEKVAEWLNRSIRYRGFRLLCPYGVVVAMKGLAPDAGSV